MSKLKVSWKYFSFILLIAITLAKVILPQNSKPFLQFEKQLLKGLDAAFKFDFERSEKIFSSIIEQYPDAPSGYHFKSISYLWKYLDNKLLELKEGNNVVDEMLSH